MRAAAIAHCPLAIYISGYFFLLFCQLDTSAGKAEEQQLHWQTSRAATQQSLSEFTLIYCRPERMAVGAEDGE